MRIIVAPCGHNDQGPTRLAAPGYLPGFLSCLRYSTPALALTCQSRPGLVPGTVPVDASRLSCRREMPNWRAGSATVMYSLLGNVSPLRRSSARQYSALFGTEILKVRKAWV